MVAENEFYRDKILECAAICGEVKIGDLFIIGSSRDYRLKIITDLVYEGILKLAEYKYGKTIRLTHKGKRLMSDKYREKCIPFFEGISETNRIRTEEHRRDRNIKLAQIKLMLMQSGVNLFYDNKPLITNESMSTRTDGSDVKNYHFYTASELKTHFEPFVKSRNSRAMGILVTGKSICILYNTGDGLMRWNRESEKFFRTNVDTQINQRFYRSSKIIKNVFLITNSNVPCQILKGSGIWHNSNLHVDVDIQNFYVARFSSEDKMLFDLIIDKFDYGEAVKHLISSLNLHRKSEASMSIRDEYGRKVLFAFDMDLKKIDAFCRQQKVYDGSCIVYCMDFQYKYIKEYCEQVCDFITMVEEDFKYASEIE